MYKTITKEEVCVFIRDAKDELEQMQRRILELTKAALEGEEAKVESILAASISTALQDRPIVQNGNATDLLDVYLRSINILRQHGREAFMELRSLVERQETITRVLAAYHRLPADQHKVLYEMYEIGDAEPQKRTATKAVERIERETGWSRSAIYNTRARALELILKIYDSHLSHRQIYQLDLSNYTGGKIERYIKEYPEDTVAIPRGLFDCEHLKELSFEALAVYGLLFHLAAVEGEVDETGARLVRFTQADLAELLRCKRSHSRTVWHELDASGAGLIEQRRRGGQYMTLVRDYRRMQLILEENGGTT